MSTPNPLHPLLDEIAAAVTAYDASAKAADPTVLKIQARADALTKEKERRERAGVRVTSTRDDFDARAHQLTIDHATHLVGKLNAQQAREHATVSLLCQARLMLLDQAIDALRRDGADEAREAADARAAEAEAAAHSRWRNSYPGGR